MARSYERPLRAARRFGPIAFAVLAGTLSVASCDRPDPYYRGTGLGVDSLPVRDLVAIYRSVLGEAFNIRDPALAVLIDPLYLPRTSGLAGGDSISPEVLTALRSIRAVKGTCSMQEEAVRTPLVCRADRAGYVARISRPFALGADSIQVNLAVQQFAIPGGAVEQRLRFERAYRVVRSRGGWTVLSEARLPAP